MAFVLSDRVKETAVVSGTGAVTLLASGAGAQSGFVAFASVMADTNTTNYAVVDQVTGAWEVRAGTFTAATPSLSRDACISSSAGGTTAVVFAGNACDVFMTAPGSRLLVSAAAPLVLASGALSLAIGSGLVLSGGTLTATPGAGGLLAANNLSDVASAASSRANLGLGGAATRNVGTTTGTVAAGDDARITGAAPLASGSFTPQLQFGGASVGMTGTAYGQYSQIGNVLFFQAFVTLTAKGSSTGGAALNLVGLTPPVSLSVNNGARVVNLSNVAGVSGLALATCYSASYPILTLWNGAYGGSQLADTNFTNTSVISVHGHWFTS